MIVLAIETAAEPGSVALLAKEDMHEKVLDADQPQSAGLLLAAARCLQEAGLALSECDAIAVDRGPGSFTGLRVGMGVAQGLAYGIGRPVVTVSSLRALAQAHNGPVLALLDARMQEVYWGCYLPDADGWMQPLGVEHVSAPEAVVVATQPQPWRVVGTGWERYRDRFVRLNLQSIEVCDTAPPRACDIARLGAYLLGRGDAGSPLAVAPAYLRNQVANKP